MPLEQAADSAGAREQVGAGQLPSPQPLPHPEDLLPDGAQKGPLVAQVGDELAGEIGGILGRRCHGFSHAEG